MILCLFGCILIGMMSETCFFLTSVVGFGGHLGVAIHLECLDEDS